VTTPVEIEHNGMLYVATFRVEDGMVVLTSSFGDESAPVTAVAYRVTAEVMLSRLVLEHLHPNREARDL
jgi:hypothetical protein